MVRHLRLLAVTTFLLAACSPAVVEHTSPPVPDVADDLHVLYQTAVEDAASPHPSDIYRGLTPITSYNTSLIWNDVPGDSSLLVATWTSESPGVDGESVVTTGDTWVTVAPELAEFCRPLEVAGEALDLRLAQVLGLPPDVEYDRVVELWVKPRDLFRPCSDPQISDSQCELAPPEPSHLIRIDEDHQAWMAELEAASYEENGYPWTRLGYTYDWGDPESNIGLSEFVIQPGSTVEINGVHSTADYCQ